MVPLRADKVRPPLPNLSLAAASPEYATALAKQQAIRARIGEITDEIRKLVPMLSRQMDDKSVAAAASLAPAFDIAGVAQPKPSEAGLAWSRYRELTAEMEQLRGADRILHPEMAQLVPRASAVVREKVEPEFRARAQAYYLALVAVGRRWGEFRELADALNAEGVQWSVLGVPNQFKYGVLHDPNSTISIDLRDGVRLGLIDEEDLR